MDVNRLDQGLSIYFIPPCDGGGGRCFAFCRVNDVTGREKDSSESLPVTYDGQLKVEVGPPEAPTMMETANQYWTNAKTAETK